MSPLVLEKPVFTKDQVVSATEASKSLSAVRKRAKRAPQFITFANLSLIASRRIESKMDRTSLFRLRML